MSELERIVVVGASLAGLRATETLRREGFEGALTVLGEEPHPPYDRPPLSKEVLLGEMQPQETALPVGEDLDDVNWLLGDPATSLDAERRVVRTTKGAEFPYDGLVLATGSEPRRLPGLEPDGERVIDLRTIDDSLRLRGVLETAHDVLIVGAGFIGVEVAAAARQRDIPTTIVTLDPPLLPAGQLAGQVAMRLLEEHSVTMWPGRTVLSIANEGQRRSATLDDGTTISADVVVVAIGARPRVDWLAGSGVPLDDGIVCDECLRVLGLPGVVAAGDVARWPHPLFDGRPMRIEHWSNAVEQGAAAAKALLAGEAAQPFAALPTFWSDHFGIRLQSVGLPALADEFMVTAGDVASGRFGAAAYCEGELVGGVAYGMPKALIALRSQLTNSSVPG
jgi:3-phenylpropionate/trans-cinnamate dioxygenase ferredoxin reductase subunit